VHRGPVRPAGGRNLARARYDRAMAVETGTLQEQLEEIRTQLGWVRDYL
jgi:hypothetical protein